MRRRLIYILCIILLVSAWALDVFSPQLVVVAILLSVPIALSSITLNRRFTLVLVLVALLADGSAGWYNATQDQHSWDLIALGDRFLAGLSIALVGLLSVAAQQQALHAGELAERQARSEVLRDLIYALSHDLRTPLAAARMTMHQALGGAYGELPPQYREILVRSIASNEELNRMAETLLLVARYESGDQSPMRDPVDVGDVARIVSKELEPLAISKSIALTAEMPSSPLYVLGDDAELRRAITNLLANAVTWTPHGGKISIVVNRDGGEIVVTIEDNGYGIPVLARENLFQRFSGRSRQGAGSGLGLYIVRRIAQGHNGSVEYKPADPSGTGSIFTLRLPAIAGDL